MLLVLPEAITMKQWGHLAQRVVCVEWRGIRGVFKQSCTGCIPPPTHERARETFQLCAHRAGRVFLSFFSHCFVFLLRHPSWPAWWVGVRSVFVESKP